MELFGKVWNYIIAVKKEAAAEWNEGLKSKTLRDWKKLKNCIEQALKGDF